MIQVRISLRGRDKPWSRTVKTRSSTVEDIIIEAGLNPLEVLIKINGEFVPDTQRVKSGDRLELLEITSRG
jgi:sulfur carrier protein ThiS